MCLQCHPPRLHFLGELAQNSLGQAAGPLGQDSGQGQGIVRATYAPGESAGKWAPACHCAGGGRGEGGPPFCWVNMGVQACLGTSRALSVKGAGQHFTKLGVARCQREGDREEHMGDSTNLAQDSTPPALARSRVETAGGLGVPS